MLQSKLLAGDSRLQRCAVDNASHVKEGDAGPFVRLIQYALLAIDDTTSIADAEVKASLYGPSTAAAVLAYKTDRKIINPSYQSKPDAIVGIMTIKALDDEIMAEERGQPSRQHLRGFHIRTQRP